MAGKGLIEGGRTGTVRNAARLCTGKSRRTGGPCGRYAYVGEERCKFHLGRKPKQTAEQLLDAVKVGEAVAAIEDPAVRADAAAFYGVKSVS